MKKQLLQEINRQKEMMGVLHEQTRTPIRGSKALTSLGGTLIDELKELLETWGTTTYISDSDRWNKYHEDIAALVEKYEDDYDDGLAPILQDPGHGGSTPSLEYQLANPDTLERGEY